MDRYIAYNALEQYKEIKSVFDANRDKTLDELYNIFHEKYYGNVFGSDEDASDISLNFVNATIKTVGGKPSLMETFDVSVTDELGGYFLYGYTVSDLEHILENKESETGKTKKLAELETLTELEKQKAISCVGYIENKFKCDCYKLYGAYDKLGHYDEEHDKALEHAKEMAKFYSNLVEKLKAIL